MNRNRNQQEQDNHYQNPRNHPRVYHNRSPNLNPHYQNPVDIVRNHNRSRRQNEPEENIYERLDNDEEINEVIDLRRNDNNENNDHMYERVDNRTWYRGQQNSRNFHQLPGLLAIERNSRDIYFQNQNCLNRFGNLSRNCFSSDNVSMAGNNGRLFYQFGNCMCQYCMRLPFIRYHICQHCNTFGNSNNFNGNSRHYIYQVSRNCRCSYCRGEYSYRFPINARGLMDSLRCQCRNPGNCNCRGRLLTSSNSAIYIGRIDRIGTVNNPLYANPTVYVGRIERAASQEAAEGNNEAAGGGAGASAAAGEPGPSGEARAQAAASSSVCAVSNNTERQHTCDDSCIRGQGNNVGGICQFSRAERPECHGRFSYHWWFVNRWLPGWGSADRSTESANRLEENREPPGSDSDDV